MRSLKVLLLLMIATRLSLADASPTAARVIGDVEFPKWEADEKLRLADFSGEIVVLDFFAYWCAPCRQASTEIETGIRQHYEAQSGNPHGFPVRVLSVNIEPENPRQTARFIREVGAHLVVNDTNATLFTELGGQYAPFIVILDGTRAAKERPEFRVVYRESDFAGIGRLRQIIDAIGAPSTAPAAARHPSTETPPATGRPVEHKGGIAFEAMLAEDIQLTTASFDYGQTRGSTEWKLGYTHNTYGVDYEPYSEFDFFGFSTRLDENYHAGQASFRQALGNYLKLSLAGGVYDGFTDYRSLWLANYYRQQNVLPGVGSVPGYTDPDPHGFNASTAMRWEYLPAAGFVEAGFLYANDKIAPGYEFDSELGRAVHSTDQLHTHAPSLKFENVLTSRIRTQHEFQLAFTTDRETRFGYRGALNVALGERWVWRTSGGYTHEDPTLRAWHVAATLEFELTHQWLLSASALYYHDTGEIENSLFISTAAPGLETWQCGLGVRYTGSRSSFHLAVSPVWSDYEPVEVGTRPFTNLYRDRTWLSVQAAWGIVF